MHAEDAYLFRHALLRDAAYQMQMPGDRAKLHELAFYLIEEAFGGRAPEPPPLDTIDPPDFEPHSTDSVAAELAAHSDLAHEGSLEDSMGPLRKLYLRRVAEHAERIYEAGACVRAWQQLALHLDGTRKGEALLRAAHVLRPMGLTQLAQTLCEQALAIQKKTGSRWHKCRALGTLAGVYADTGRMNLAEQTYEESLAVANELGDHLLRGKAIANLAIVYQDTGRLELAAQYYGQALAISEAIGDVRIKGVVVGNLGGLIALRGNREEADRYWEQALTIHRENGNRRAEGVVLGNLAASHLKDKRIAQAEKCYHEALSIDREVGDRPAEGAALGGLAGVYFETGRIEQAERTLDAAMGIAREVGDRHHEALYHDRLALMQQRAGRLEQAAINSIQALNIFREFGSSFWVGHVLLRHALLEIAVGHHAAARKAWAESAKITYEQGDRDSLAHNAAAMREACAKAGLAPFDVPGLDEASSPPDE